MKWYQDSIGNTSSKRVIGAIGFFVYGISVIGLNFYSVFTGNDIGTNASNLLNGLGGFSAGMIIGGVVEGFANKRKEAVG